MTRSNVSEHDEQVVVIQWADWHRSGWPELKWLHSTPNGAKLPYKKLRGGVRISREAIRLRAEGLTPGVSDLFLPVPKNGFCGLWIEMKVGDNKPTKDQLEFMADMNSRGYLAMAAWGSEYAVACIATYLGIPQDEWW
jgi:hypothetical protein